MLCIPPIKMKILGVVYGSEPSKMMGYKSKCGITFGTIMGSVLKSKKHTLTHPDQETIYLDGPWD